TEIAPIRNEQSTQLDRRPFGDVETVDHDLPALFYPVLLAADFDDGEHPDSSYLFISWQRPRRRRPRATQYSRVVAGLPPPSADTVTRTRAASVPSRGAPPRDRTARHR